MIFSMLSLVIYGCDVDISESILFSHVKSAIHSIDILLEYVYSLVQNKTKIFSQLVSISYIGNFQAVKDLYTQLTPIQLLHIACHPNRPTFLDHVLNITDKVFCCNIFSNQYLFLPLFPHQLCLMVTVHFLQWVELHGGCAAYDDPAIVLGIESIDGKSYMLIGHRKGRNTKEHIQRNFGMLTPHG